MTAILAMVFTCLLLLLFPPQLWAADDKVLDVSAESNQAALPLTEYFTVLEDPGQALSLADVRKPEAAGRFQPVPPNRQADLAFGFTRSAWWLRLHLRNGSSQAVERMLQIDHARITSVQFHEPLEAGGYRSVVTGTAEPFATRAYANRGFVFPIAVPAQGDKVVFLRLQSVSTLVVPARLWAPQSFYAHERADYSAQAWYFGMASAMILFNLLLFVALRDVIYLLYVGLVTSMALTLGTQNGLTKEFLWPGALGWSDISFIVFSMLAFVSVLLFMRLMLNTRQLIPRLEPVLKVLVVVFLLIPVGMAVAFQALVRWSTLLQFATLVLILGVGVYCAFVKRQRSAYFFLAAFAAPLVGAFLMVLRNLGALPTNALTVNALQIGSAAEMLLLALALADRFERTLQLQALNDKLEALSITDALTGIANRRRFNDVLAAEWSRAARLGQPLAVALIDVDWFKPYNDHYGHQRGDECLHAVAQCIAATVCRTGDLVARYGGEEFVFIAPNTDNAAALSMATKVCEAIQALALPNERSDFGLVTVSIGVAAVVPGEGGSAQLLKRADDALYRAKQQGRNRVVLGVSG